MTSYLPELFRIKIVEPIRLIPAEQGHTALKKAGYNLFAIPAEDIFISMPEFYSLEKEGIYDLQSMVRHT